MLKTIGLDHHHTHTVMTNYGKPPRQQRLQAMRTIGIQTIPQTTTLVHAMILHIESCVYRCTITWLTTYGENDRSKFFEHWIYKDANTVVELFVDITVGDRDMRHVLSTPLKLSQWTKNYLLRAEYRSSSVLKLDDISVLKSAWHDEEFPLNYEDFELCEDCNRELNHNFRFCPSFLQREREEWAEQ